MYYNHLSRAGVAEWFTASCLLPVARMVVGSSPEPPPVLADMSASTWVEKAWLPYWPLYSQQVSHQRWIWGSHKWESTQWTHPGFETQGRHHQKSKTGVSVAPQKGLMSSKNYNEFPLTLRLHNIFKKSWNLNLYWACRWLCYAVC